jgi:hypothetical protein
MALFRDKGGGSNKHFTQDEIGVTVFRDCANFCQCPPDAVHLQPLIQRA